jgi:hypothetical protein
MRSRGGFGLGKGPRETDNCGRFNSFTPLAEAPARQKVNF